MFQYPLDGGAEAAADLQATITEFIHLTNYNLRKKFINSWVANIDDKKLQWDYVDG